MGDVRELLATLQRESRGKFEANARIKTFGQYLGDIAEEPCRYVRSAPQYVLEMIDHFGTEEVAGVGRAATRYRVFDAPFDDGRDRIHGQEEVQAEIYQTLRSSVITGRNDRLILMHGPNGSSKSSIVDALFRGLEHYARKPEGTIYRFHWIFPSQRYLGRRVGFGVGFDGEAPAGAPAEPASSYAFLDQEDVAARVPCELKDHPLLVLPREERRTVLEELFEEARQSGRKVPTLGGFILEGGLCPKCRIIFEGLLAAYRGDLARVLAHVQVERSTMSRRYRQSLVTIDPQITADAGARQLTMDRSVADLPPYLQNVTLHELHGDLVDANNGIVEYSDILKRNVEANKYLLTACETGFITTGGLRAQLNVVMIGSSNEKHLDLFKKSPDFTSFKGRFKLVPTPYLLQYGKEARIYEDRLAPMRALKHLAPHTCDLAGLWAVLTRLRRPDPAGYPAEVRDVIRKMTPIQKARLYDHQETPTHLDAREGNALRGAVASMRDEFRDDPRYEGRYGAGPREMRDLLLGCFYDGRHACVSPLALLDALSQMVLERTLYDFLSIEPDNHYHDHAKFIEDVREELLDRVNEEVRDSLELVAEDEVVRAFERYVLHVKAYVKREKMYQETTRTYENPDERLMGRVEGILEVRGDAAAFRTSVIGRIGAWMVDHAGQEMDYQDVFPEYMARMREDFYRSRKKLIEQISRHLLTAGTDEFENLEPEAQERVRRALARMRDHHGYCDRCAKEAIVHLIRRRYA